jgi:hypothetical protein
MNVGQENNICRRANCKGKDIQHARNGLKGGGGGQRTLATTRMDGGIAGWTDWQDTFTQAWMDVWKRKWDGGI